MVFDVTNKASFQNIVKWYQEIQGYACDKIELFVVGNKVDLEDRYYISKNLSREVSTEEAQKLAAKHGFEYFETSAKTGQNIDAVFERMT